MTKSKQNVKTNKVTIAKKNDGVSNRRNVPTGLTHSEKNSGQLKLHLIKFALKF